MAEPRWLTPAEDRAWRGWVALSEAVQARLARDLWQTSGLSEADYAVLVHLSESVGHRMRMSDMATALRWSKSRLSHQTARMQRRGLVAREECPSDARGSFAVLTGEGLAEITAAAPHHVASVRRHLIDLLTDQEQIELAELSEAVLARLRAEPETPSDAADAASVASENRAGNGVAGQGPIS